MLQIIPKGTRRVKIKPVVIDMIYISKYGKGKNKVFCATRAVVSDTIKPVDEFGYGLTASAAVHDLMVKCGEEKDNVK